MIDLALWIVVVFSVCFALAIVIRGKISFEREIRRSDKRLEKQNEEFEKTKREIRKIMGIDKRKD